MDAVSSYRTELIGNESDFVCSDDRRLVSTTKFNVLSSKWCGSLVPFLRQ